MEELSDLRSAALEQLRDLDIDDSTKTEINQYVNFLTIEKKRFELGVTSKEPECALLFEGPENVGQLETAIVVASLLMANQVIENNHVIECQIEDVLPSIESGNDIQLKEIIDKAREGMLYLYSDDFSRIQQEEEDYETFRRLLRNIKNNMTNLCVVLAANPTESARLPEIDEMFANRVVFKPHSNQQTLNIILDSLKENGFSIEDDAIHSIRNYLKDNEQLLTTSNFTQRIVNVIKLMQANRLKENMEADFMMILNEDVVAAIQHWTRESRTQ